MGLTPNIRKKKDNSRYFEYGGDKLVEQMVKKLPNQELIKKGTIEEIAMSIVKEKIKDKKKKKQRMFLVQTIIRHAIGKGFLVLLGSNKKLYKLTNKSLQIRKLQDE